MATLQVVRLNVLATLQVVRLCFKKHLGALGKQEGGGMGAGEHGEILDGREKPIEAEPFRFSTSVATEEMARAVVDGVTADLRHVEVGGSPRHPSLHACICGNSSAPGAANIPRCMPASAVTATSLAARGQHPSLHGQHPSLHACGSPRRLASLTACLLFHLIRLAGSITVIDQARRHSKPDDVLMPADSLDERRGTG